MSETMAVIKEPTIMLENLGTRAGFGEILFENKQGYKYPVAEFPASVANKILNRNKRTQEKAERDAVSRRTKINATRAVQKPPLAPLPVKHFKPKNICTVRVAKKTMSKSPGKPKTAADKG